MNERIVYEASVYHALPWLRTVHDTLPRVESRLQIGNFMCCYMTKLFTTNGAQFKFHLPGGVFAWSFLLRLEHLAVRITSTIEHSLRFQQEGAIEWLLEWMTLISNFLQCITTIHGLHFAVIGIANFLSKFRTKLSRRVNFPS